MNQDVDYLSKIRTIGIIAHIDAGKTTTTERMLFYSGKIHRMGEVDNGTTTMDFLEEERERGITIISATTRFTWNNHAIQLIDTPGHMDFFGEVERSLRVIDGAVVIFSGLEGVEAQSETVWRQADHYHLPRIAYINKMDRPGADFYRVYQEIGQKFKQRPILLNIPVGSEQNFHAIIDLIEEKTMIFGGEEGEILSYEPIPQELQDDVYLYRQQLFEILADYSDEIAELFLSEQSIPISLIKKTLRELTCKGILVPVLCGASRRNIGVQPLLDAVVDYLPSPADIQSVPCFRIKDESQTTCSFTPEGPTIAFVFKIKAGSSGDMYLVRVYSGTLKTGQSLYVPRIDEMIKIKHIYYIYAQEIESIDSLKAGEIGGIIGPKNLTTGDTLCLRHHAVFLEKPHFPEPVISIALEPKTSKDKDKLLSSLELICREDPTLHLSHSEETGQQILSGMGELHLEIAIHRLEREFHLQPRCGEPRVAYRETFKNPIEISTTFKKILGEQEFFAGITAKFHPIYEQSLLNQIDDQIPSTSNIPPHLRKAAVKALYDALSTGGNQGYPLIGVSGSIINLEWIPEKTTEGAIVGAALQLVNEAIQQIGTIILEPVMELEVFVPNDYLGNIHEEIQARNGLVMDITEHSGFKKILCSVPLSSMFGFSKAFPKLTGGRGGFVMKPKGYQPLTSSTSS